MENLTEEEINILIEAMDSWISKDSTGEFMSEILGALLTDKMTDEGKEKLKQDRHIEKIKRDQSRREREEKAILMKAKLIQIRKLLTTQAIDNFRV